MDNGTSLYFTFIHIIYLSKAKEELILVKYIELMPLDRGTVETVECMFTTILGLLNKMHLNKLVYIVMGGFA